MKEELADVTLISEEHLSFKAHKLILSLFSPVIKSFIGLSTEGNTVIHLRGTKGKDIQSLLDYFYNGEVKLEKENVAGFLDLANSFKIIERSNIENDLKDLLTIIQNEKIKFLVFGLPKSLDNKATITSQRAKSFANFLNQNSNIDIFFWDERFSSKSAEKIAYKTKEFKNKHDDSLAATIILQNFLDFKNMNKR